MKRTKKRRLMTTMNTRPTLRRAARSATRRNTRTADRASASTHDAFFRAAMRARDAPGRRHNSANGWTRLRAEDGAGDEVHAEAGEDREVEQPGRGHHRGVVTLPQ